MSSSPRPAAECDNPGIVDWGALARTLGAVLCVALVYPVILLAAGVPLSARGFFENFLASAIFGGCIGIAANLVPWNWIESRLKTSLSRALAQILMLAVLAAIGEAIATLVLMLMGWVHGYWAFYRANWPVVTLITLLVGGAISIYETIRKRLENATLELRTKELERERALKLATEARLSSLESQLHPHFLFNTLNSISSLIPDDPARAERLVEQMAALLRFSLDSSRQGVVPIERELKIVKDYLEIEQARLGDRLKFTLAIEPGVETLQVPPLALQTLVENSIKHVIAPDRAGGWISVSGIRSNGTLTLAVRDSGPGFNLDQTPTGHGIENLRGRLAALYGNAASLATIREDGAAVVRLVIPIQS